MTRSQAGVTGSVTVTSVRSAVPVFVTVIVNVCGSPMVTVA